MLCQSYLALFLSAVRFQELQKNNIFEREREREKEREKERERELGCVLTCTLTLFLSLVWLACLINITSPQRSSTKLLLDTTGFILKRQQVSVTMRQQLSLNPTPFSACVCFRYCSSGNYCRWYGGLLHSAAYVSAGARLLPLPPTQRQWVHKVVL